MINVPLKFKVKLERSEFEEQNFLLFLAYLIEKSSEHPIAETIVRHVKSQLKDANAQEEMSMTVDSIKGCSYIQKQVENFSARNFKQKSGEGVSCALVDHKTGEEFTVCFGNRNLLES